MKGIPGNKAWAGAGSGRGIARDQNNRHGWRGLKVRSLGRTSREEEKRNQGWDPKRERLAWSELRERKFLYFPRSAPVLTQYNLCRKWLNDQSLKHKSILHYWKRNLASYVCGCGNFVKFWNYSSSWFWFRCSEVAQFLTNVLLLMFLTSCLSQQEGLWLHEQDQVLKYPFCTCVKEGLGQKG